MGLPATVASGHRGRYYLSAVCPVLQRIVALSRQLSTTLLLDQDFFRLFVIFLVWLALKQSFTT